MRFNRFARFAACALTMAFISASVAANAQEKPRVNLPQQAGFFDGATALYITPEIGVDAAAGTPTFATAQQIAKGFNSNFIP